MSALAVATQQTTIVMNMLLAQGTYYHGPLHTDVTFGLKYLPDHYLESAVLQKTVYKLLIQSGERTSVALRSHKDLYQTCRSIRSTLELFPAVVAEPDNGSLADKVCPAVPERGQERCIVHCWQAS